MHPSRSLARTFVALTFALAGAAQAATITNGFTFAVASSSGNTAIGTHYHSNTGGAFGNPAGKAEVGRFGSEGVRGLSEYSLVGLSNASSAFVTFNVFKAGGLFPGTNDFPFVGTIKVDGYAGNNTEDISDYEAASIGGVGSFGTGALAVGGVLSFDITSLFNAALANGDTSLGIRLIADPLNNTGAWTFDTFRLTSDNQTSVVPVPAGLPLMLTGLVALGLRSFRRRA
ncbi:MAG: VPLPA-CTERM sorting domain-containing protein [Burkholderiales bacterium]|nr:VPLPA-CTERM sorting domain-containing protein [Burkholderiales bacterium]